MRTFSSTRKPAAPMAQLRELSEDQLDQVVGGAGPAAAPDPHQFDQAAGFDTSSLHLDAAALASGQGEADVAHAVADGQATDIQAIHLLETAATTDHTSVTQALAGFAGQITGVSGHMSDGYLVGGEIANLISTNQVTTGQALQDLGAAVTAHSLNADQAISVLAGVAAHGGTDLQNAVGGEIATLINDHQIPADKALTDIGSALSSHNLSPDQSIAVLSGLAAHGDAALQGAVGGEIAALIADHQIPAASALADVGAAVATHNLTLEQSIAVLAGVAAHGDAALQVAVGAEISTLVAQQDVPPGEAFSDVAKAVGAGLLDPTQAIAVFVGFGAQPGGLADATTQIESLVSGQSISADEAVAALAVLAAQNPANVSTAGSAIALLIDEGQLSASEAVADIGLAVAGNTLNPDRAVAVLASLAANGDTEIKLAAGGEASALVAGGYLSASQAMADLHNAVTSNALTAADAIPVILGFAAQHGTSGQAAAGASEIAALVSSHQITADQAVAVLAGTQGADEPGLQAAANQATVRLVADHLITANHAIEVLTGTAATGGADLQNAAGQVVAALVTAHQITADQAVTTLTGVAAQPGNAALQVTVGTEVYALVSGGLLTASQAVTDIDRAVTAHTLTGAAAIPLLVGFSAHEGNFGQLDAAAGEISALVSSRQLTADQAVTALTAAANLSLADAATAGYDVAALIGRGQITAAQAIGDINGAYGAHALSADETVGLLAGIAVGSGNVATQVAAGSAIGQLLGRAQVTGTEAVGVIEAAAATGILPEITATQHLSLFEGLAAGGGTSGQIAAGNGLFALVADGLLTASQASGAIGDAVTAHVLTAAQAIPLLVTFAAQTGEHGELVAGIGEIAALVAHRDITADQAVAALAGAGSHLVSAAEVAGYAVANLVSHGQITTAQALADIGAAVAAHTLSAKEAGVVFAGLAAGSTDAPTQLAAGAAIGQLVASQQITGAQAVADVAAVTNGSGILPALPVTQTLTLLEGIATTGGLAGQAAAGNGIAALIDGGQLTGAQALTAISGAITAHTLTGVQAAGVIAGVTAGGNTALDLAAGQAVLGLVTGGQITAAQAIAAVDGAVAGHFLGATDAIRLLVGYSAQAGNFAQIGVAANEIGALVSGHQITAGDAVAALTAVAGVAPADAAAAGNAVAALIAQGQITARDAVAGVGAAVAGHSLTADQAAVTLAAVVAASGTNTAVQLAAGGGIGQLIASGQISPAQALSDLAAAIVPPLTVGQNVAVLEGIAATGGIPGEVAASNGIFALVSSGRLTSANAIASIDGAVTAHALTAAQAIPLLVGFAAHTGNFGQLAAASGEIAALVSHRQITADQAVGALSTIATQGAAFASVAGYDIAALISRGQITANQAATDLRAAVTAHTLSADQAVTVLAGVAIGSNAANAVAAGNAIGQLIATGQTVGALALADIRASAVAGIVPTLPLAQNIALLEGIAATGGVAGGAAAGSGLYALVAGGQLNTAQAIGNIHSAVTAATPILTAAQAVPLILGFEANAGNSGQLAAGAAEIGALVGRGGFTADQAVAALTAAAQSPGLAATAGYDVAALISQGRITAAQAIGDVNTAVRAHTVSADQAVTVLAGLASGAGSLNLPAAAVISTGAAIGQLIATNQIGGDAVLSDLAAVSAAGLLPTATAAASTATRVALLEGIASTGGAAGQAAAGTGFYNLVSGSQLTSAQATAAIDGAVRAHVLAGTDAIPLLVGFAAHAGNFGQAAAGATEIASLITSRQLTADQAVTALASAAGAMAGTEFAAIAGYDIAALIGRGQITATQAVADISGALRAHTLTADQAAGVLTGVGFSSTNAATQLAAGNAIGQLIASGQIGAIQAVNDISSAFASGSADRALTFSLSAYLTISEGLAATGGNAGGIAAGDIFFGQVVNGNLTPAQAITNINNAIGAHALTAAQAIPLIAAFASQDTSFGQVSAATATAIGTAAANEIVSLVTSRQVTADQAVGALSGVAGAGTATLAAAAGSEIYALVAAGQLNASRAVTDINNAVNAHSLTAAQAIPLVVSFAAQNGNFGQQAAGAGEIVALVSGHQLTADQAVTVLAAAASQGAAAAAIVGYDIAALVTANQIAGRNAVGDVAGVAGLNPDRAAAIYAGIALGTTDPATQVAAGAGIGQLIAGHRLTADQAFADIAATGGNVLPALTVAQNVALLEGIAVTGGVAGELAAGGALYSLVSHGRLSATDALANIDGAVAAHLLTAAQAIPLIVGFAAQTGNFGQQTAGANEISALVAGHQITADQAVGALAAAASLGGAAALIAGYDVASLVSHGQITPAQAVTDLGAAVTAHVLSADQAVSALTGLAGTSTDPAAQLAAGAGIGRLIAGHQLSGDQVLADIGNAIATHILPALTTAQSVAVFEGIASTGGLAGGLAAGNGLYGLVASNALTATQAIAAISSAVAAHALTAAEAIPALIGLASNDGFYPQVSAAQAQAITVAAAAQLVALAAGHPDQAVAELAAIAATQPTAAAIAGYGVAALVAAGQVTATQAISAVGAAVAAHSLQPAQAVALFTGLAAGSRDNAAQIAAGAAIGDLIAHTQVTAAHALTDIANASAIPGLPALTVAQNVALLEGIASTGGPLGDAVAGTGLRALVDSGRLSAADAVAVIGSAVAAHLLTGEQAISTLASLATGTPDHGQLAAGVHEISLLVSTHAISADRALTLLANVAGANPASQAVLVNSITTLVTDHLVTPDHAITVLAGISGSTGSHGLQAAVDQAIGTLVNNHLVSANQAITDVAAAIASHSLTAHQGLAILVGISSYLGASQQTAIINDIEGLVETNQISAGQAIGLLLGAAASGGPAVQDVANQTFASLVADGLLTAHEAITLVTELSTFPIAGLSASALHAAAASEIGALISAGLITPQQAVSELLGSVTQYSTTSLGQSTVDALLAKEDAELSAAAIQQARAFVGDAAFSRMTPAAQHGLIENFRVLDANNYSRSAVGSELGLLVKAGLISPTQLTAQVDAALHDGTLKMADSISPTGVLSRGVTNVGLVILVHAAEAAPDKLIPAVAAEIGKIGNEGLGGFVMAARGTTTFFIHPEGTKDTYRLNITEPYTGNYTYTYGGVNTNTSGLNVEYTRFAGGGSNLTAVPR